MKLTKDRNSNIFFTVPKMKDSWFKEYYSVVTCGHWSNEDIMASVFEEAVRVLSKPSSERTGQECRALVPWLRQLSPLLEPHAIGKWKFLFKVRIVNYWKGIRKTRASQVFYLYWETYIIIIILSLLYYNNYTIIMTTYFIWMAYEMPILIQAIIPSCK